MIKTVIRGTGRYLPDRVVTNEDLKKYMNVTDEWVFKRTGIKERRWAEEGEYLKSSEIGEKAAIKALENANWSLDEVDLILFATHAPDLYIPGTGPIVQSKLQKTLGIKTNVPCLDIRQQCAAFVHGMQISNAMLVAGHHKKILFICAEAQTPGMDLTDRGIEVNILFADGAAAVCIEGVDTNEDVGIIASAMHTDGDYHKTLHIDLSPHYGPEWIENNNHWPHMDGKIVYQHAVKRLPVVINEVLEKANMSIDDVDLFLPHQANQRINDSVAKRLKLAPEKVFNNVVRYGNTTAATIPISLDEVFERNMTPKNIMFFAYGSGEHWGAVLYRHMYS